MDIDFNGSTDTTLKFELYSDGGLTTIYNETRTGTVGNDYFGNFIDPVMITESDEDYTIVGISCQISPGNGWSTKAYNSNQSLIGYANMAGYTDPALNPIYLT